VTPAEQRELYLMLRDDRAGGSNRGREFYDGYCQTCEFEYEAHAPDCRFKELLIALGGDEERERQRLRADAEAERVRLRAATLERHRRGVTVSSMDAMNLAFKKIYGGFGE